MDLLEKNIHKPMYMKDANGQLVEIVFYDPTSTDPVAPNSSIAGLVQKHSNASKDVEQSKDILNSKNVAVFQPLSCTSGQSLPVLIDDNQSDHLPTISSHNEAESDCSLPNKSTLLGASSSKPKKGVKRLNLKAPKPVDSLNVEDRAGAGLIFVETVIVPLLQP